MDIKESIKENVKIIGFSNEDEYNYMLKQIYTETQSRNPVIVDGGFDIPSNAQVILSVQSSLHTMNLNALQKDDIILTNNILLNMRIQSAILEILQPLLLRDYKSQIIKENFFVKHIVWIYERINEVDWEKFEHPTLIYFGDSNEDDEIHLKILNKIGFHIIYINPRMNKDNPFYKEFDIKNEIILPNYANPDKFMVRVARAKEIPKQQNEVIQTVAKKAKDEFSNTIYKNGMVFKPWQFRKGYTKPIYIDAVVEDIKTYWDQDARFREGFKVEDNGGYETLYIPNFFTKINGSLFNKAEFHELVDFTKGTQLTNFAMTTYLISSNFSKEDMFSLMFVMDYDKVDFEKVRQHKLYQLGRVNMDTQRFIINKYNEFAMKFKNSIQQIDLIHLLASLISDTSYIKLVENFDFPFRIPKLVIYLKGREAFDLNNSLFIHFLNLIGLDILIYNPTGAESIEDNLFGNYLNIINLDEMNFDLSYEELQTYIPAGKKVGFFKKLFG